MAPATPAAGFYYLAFCSLYGCEAAVCSALNGTLDGLPASSSSALYASFLLGALSSGSNPAIDGIGLLSWVHPMTKLQTAIQIITIAAITKIAELVSSHNMRVRKSK